MAELEARHIGGGNSWMSLLHPAVLHTKHTFPKTDTHSLPPHQITENQCKS